MTAGEQTRVVHLMAQARNALMTAGSITESLADQSLSDDLTQIAREVARVESAQLRAWRYL